MLRAGLIAVLITALLVGAPLKAQGETPTPTPTNTPTPTPTPFVTNMTLIPVGTILAYGYNQNLPAGWLLCDGSAVSREDYSELFQVIGTVYGGGDGSTTFNLPDLRGRTIVGSGQGVGLSNRFVGQRMGEETHLLTVNEMPSHTHNVKWSTNASSGSGSNMGTWNNAAGYSNSFSQMQATGGGQPFNVMQPSLVTAYIIWTGTETLNFGNPGSGGGPMPTEGPSPTPTPNIYQYATVEVDGVGQDVAFRYEVTAGDFLIATLLFVAVGLSLLNLVMRARERR